MSGFVVCQSCGTRIKAGREYCLRCREPLPDPDAPVRTPLWVSLGLSESKQLILGIGVALAVAALVAIIWKTQPVPVDESARPAAREAGTPAKSPDAAAPAPASTTPPPDVIDAPRVPAFEPTPVAPATQVKVASDDLASLEARRAAYEQELVQGPDDADVLNRLGQVLERMGRAGEAATRFERAIAIAPEKSTYHFNLAHAATELGQSDRAVGEYREIARLHPQDYAVQYTLALALHKKGDEEAAIPEFQKAIALAPGDPSVHLSLGVSLERVGRVSEAVREYKRFIEIQPTSAEAGRLKDHLATLSAARP